MTWESTICLTCESLNFNYLRVSIDADLRVYHVDDLNVVEFTSKFVILLT